MEIRPYEESDEGRELFFVAVVDGAVVGLGKQLY
jgi:hypothetical protein